MQGQAHARRRFMWCQVLQTQYQMSIVVFKKKKKSNRKDTLKDMSGVYKAE